MKKLIIMTLICLLVLSGNINTVSAETNNTEKFVVRLYEKVLNRKPDNDGLKYWVNNIQSGKFTILHVSTDGFFNSKEYLKKKTTNEQFVKSCYNTFLDREPEKSGFNYWVKKLKNGVSRNDVLKGFAYSKEFTDLQKKYGIGVVKVETAITSSAKTTTAKTTTTKTTKKDIINKLGTVNVPSVGYKMSIADGNCYQKIVDDKNLALYTNFMGKMMLADHASQGLKKIGKCKKGDKLIITLTNGKKITYKMTTKYTNGKNNGAGILIGKKYADEMKDGDLFSYYCNDSTGKSVTVIFWKKV